MKSQSSSRIGSFLTKIFNVKSWLDWQRIQAFTLYLLQGARRLFVLEETTDTASFEAVKKRLKLTDSELLARQKGLFRLAIIMVSLAFALFLYALYLFYSASFKAGALCLVVTSIALALAFRYHFWYFQMKEKKLGCTFHEWFKKGLMGEK